MTIVWIVAGIVCIGAFVAILRNFHRQKDFERSDHVVPETYD